jgi:hypothetical protein
MLILTLRPRPGIVTWSARRTELAAHPAPALWENTSMTGVQFVTDNKGRKVAVVSESRRQEVGIPLEKVKADLVKRGRLRG